MKDLRSQLEHLRSEHSFLSKLTGFNIRNYSKMEDIVNTEETEKGTHHFLTSMWFLNFIMSIFWGEVHSYYVVVVRGQLSGVSSLSALLRQSFSSSFRITSSRLGD